MKMKMNLTDDHQSKGLYIIEPVHYGYTKMSEFQFIPVV